MSATPYFVGIDVAKAQLDIALRPTGERWTVPNDDAGIAALVARLRPFPDLTVHLLAAAPNRSYLEAHGFGLDRFIAEPLVVRDGLALAPDRPGHGIEFDWKGLDALRS